MNGAEPDNNKTNGISYGSVLSVPPAMRYYNSCGAAIALYQMTSTTSNYGGALSRCDGLMSRLRPLEVFVNDKGFQFISRKITR